MGPKAVRLASPAKRTFVIPSSCSPPTTCRGFPLLFVCWVERCKCPAALQQETMPSLVVTKVRDSEWNKSVFLGEEELVVPKSRSIQPGEKLILSGNQVLQRVFHGLCIVDPPFFAREVLKLGTEEIEVSIREPTSLDDWNQVQLLRNFHYRGRAPFGRQGVLLASIENREDAPEVSGLIEVGPAPICNSARDRVLNAPFGDNGIGWETWDYQTRGKYCKVIAEITRVVIHPDARGIGLAPILLRRASEFCRSHWQLANYKPIFAEIVADMLRFHPFPGKAGFRYVGETEGNIRRAAKDLRYQLKQMSKGVDRDHSRESSMERMQWSYARSLVKRLKENGQEIEWALKKLKGMDRESLLEYLEVFEHVVRLPKPVYLKGLTEAAGSFLQDRVPAPHPPMTLPDSDTYQPLTTQIVLQAVRVDERPPVPETRATREVCLAFGSLNQFSRRKILDIDCSITPRSVVLISGPSGSGKTTLLRILSGNRVPNSGTVQFPENFEARTPSDPPEDLALIDTLDCGTGEALIFLGQAGLSEPFLYLQRWDQLSDGQKERARLAMLLRSRANCWIVDGFGARLDTLSTQVIAARLSRIARRFGITLFVSTTRPREIRKVLEPDLEIRLQASGHARIEKILQH